eukprot:gene8109-9635_t
MVWVCTKAVQKMKEVLKYARIRPSVLQVEIHPYFRNEALVEWCAAEGIHVTAYSPLGSPDSATMLHRTAPVLMQDPAVQAITSRIGRDVGQLWNDKHKKADVIAACQASLRHLRLRHLDLYLIHWPVTGNSGDTVEPSIQETWQAMEKLVDMGMVKAIGTSNFSGAEYYANEHEVGQALHHMLSTTSLKREDVFVTGKLWNTNHSTLSVERACKESLKQLNLLYMDLYLMHWPVTGNRGAEVEPSIETTWRAMESLVDKGLVKAIGMSNFS